ncbi:hypothetical protein C7212DRAFT_293918 [Tuber magnatum]|uniref:C2H2-type domain-containing protein n=1 Tax=Tuber magnatum TaxID=42249 RepID=A0A317SRK8_9PEZI|nr:hypothetical protein C7212DRAFT_293918 [Tuber magnatum]
MSRSNHSQPKFPEGSTNLHSSHETDGDPGPHNPGIRGPKRRSTVPPDGGNSPGTPGLHSSSIDTSNSQSSAMGWNNINPEPIQYDNAINRPSIDSYICSTCGIKCKRQTDLDRHLKTARSHGAPRGPACPERGCKYTARFTRVDNFIVHYKKQHGKTDEEVHIFLQEWKA